MTDREPHSLPDTDSSTSDTRRAHERNREDAHWMPVIVKRTDEARRHPDDIVAVLNYGHIRHSQSPSKTQPQDGAGEP
jgi:hypothetical protein